ncbi:MAG TPA: Cof-type HAD-IIB family hydrolase [Candidatus Acidoferrales bacterium]|nr:Cof-type HAD-IIB family hydrolase [Candidatus Acidoferrales bacterium]
MIRSDTQKKFKLAAIDLDGTLLGPAHDISAANIRAVQRLQAGGTQVVLASGRHYNSMLKYAQALPGVQWIVSCQGGEVSDVTRSTILGRKFMPVAEAKKALELGHSLGFTTLAYTVEGVVTDCRTDGQSDFEMKGYTDLAGLQPVVLETRDLLARDTFKVIWMGDPAALTRLSLADITTPTVQAIRTQARFLEFMPVAASKGTALEILATHLGIPSADAVVFGDGDNDIPMFAWAGTSVAMPHGWPLALRNAKHVAPAGPAETAFARAVDLVLQPPPACVPV